MQQKQQPPPGDQADSPSPSEEHEGRWWLVAQMAPLDPRSNHEIAVIREVAGEELDQTKKANKLLRRFASITSYARLVDLYNQLVAFYERDGSLVAKSAAMNRAVQSLGVAAHRFVEDLQMDIASEFGIPSQAESITTSADNEFLHPNLRMLVEMHRINGDIFKIEEEVVAIDSDSLSSLPVSFATTPTVTNLLSGLQIGLAIAQRLVGHYLLTFKSPIEEASLMLRRLAAEVPDGSPALIRAEGLDSERETESVSLGRTTIDGFALEEGRQLHRALRLSEKLLKTAIQIPNHPFTELSTTGVKATPPSNRSSDSSDGSLNEARHNAESNDSVIIEWYALIDHAVDFNDKLERAWSGALDGALAASAYDELEARFSSVFLVLNRLVTTSDQEVAETGADPKIDVFPLPYDRIVQLSAVPSLEQRWRQLQVALLEVLQSTLNSLRALKEPSARRINLITGHQESWWEAGAFQFLRAQCRLLARICDEQLAAKADLLGEDFRRGIQPWNTYLQLAGAAYRNGDPEAAVLHAYIALNKRMQAEGDERPEAIIEWLAANSPTQNEAKLLKLVIEAATAFREGKPIDIGAVLLFAPYALELIQAVCLDEAIFRSSVRKEENDEP